MTTDGPFEPQDRVGGLPARAPGQAAWDAPMPVIGEVARPQGAPLPVARSGTELSPALPPAAAQSTVVALLGDTRRDGPWTVASTTSVWCGLGDAKLDLREATFESPEVTITVTSLMGDLTVTVAPDTDVVLRGFSVLGDRRVRKLTESSTPGPPVRRVTVEARGLLGDVTVNIIEPGRELPSRWKRWRDTRN